MTDQNQPEYFRISSSFELKLSSKEVDESVNAEYDSLGLNERGETAHVSIVQKRSRDTKIVDQGSKEMGSRCQDPRLETEPDKAGKARPVPEFSSSLPTPHPQTSSQHHQYHTLYNPYTSPAMGKNKRLKATGNQSKKGTHKLSKLTRPAGISKPQSKSQSQSQKQNNAPSKPKAQNKPILPFSPTEQILLIGEGDLSFASSLITHHGCTHITATVLESEKELREKYPHVGEHISTLEDGGGKVVYGVDAGKMKPWVGGGKGGGRKEGVMDRIFFNFPHVGGKSTDVNRQVRYNQELLVSFFTRALPSLSPTHGSSIIITLFEGSPYTLWNIRDLARHSGLEVAQSFRFQASAYPGYKHARTLGVVRGKNGKEGGGWKGEERSARSYVFVRKGEGEVQGAGRKGKREESSDDEDDLVEDVVDEVGEVGGGSEGLEHEDGSMDDSEGGSDDDGSDDGVSVDGPTDGFEDTR